MSVREVVRIVRSYLEDEGATLERRHGSQAVTVAQDLATLLETRLQEETAYISLWDQVEVQPQQTAMKLAGALEALVEADPALARRMEAFLDEYRRVIASVSPEREAPRRGTGTYTPPDGPGTYSEDGTYLYGNLRPGVTSRSEVGEGELPAAADVETAALDTSQVISLFQEMYVLVEEHEVPSPAIKRKLRAKLERVATDIVAGEEEYETSMIDHLRAVERLSPPVYRVVIEKLAGPEASFAPAVQRVARRMMDIG